MPRGDSKTRPTALQRGLSALAATSRSSRSARGATAGVKQPAPKAPAPRMARGATMPPKPAPKAAAPAPAKSPARSATTSISRSSMSEPAPRRMTADERRANATRKEQPKVSVRPAPSAYTDVSPAPKTRPKTSPVAPSSRSSVTVPKPSVDRSVDIPKPSVSAPKPSTPASKPMSMTAPKPKSPAKFGKTDGGDYPVYDKKSKSAESFRSAFARARKGGAKTFTWVGADGVSRKYTTDVK